MEGQGTLKYPGITFCVTNWLDREKFCERYESACNFSDPDWREQVLYILETEGHLEDLAISSADYVQFGFVNPTSYFVETYVKRESVRLSFSKLPKHMCCTINWRADEIMKFVHQNPLIFEAKLLFFWEPESIIVMDEYEMDIGFHDVDATTAGQKHAIVVQPSGEYIFSLEQRVVNYLPAPYDTMCTDYYSRGLNSLSSSLYTKELCYEECKVDVIQQNCNCILKDYVFRHRINGTVCSQFETDICVRGSRRHVMKVCEAQCGKGCKEYIYDTKQAFWRTHDPDIEGEYYIRVKFLMTSRSVDVMQIIPLLQGTQILGIIGGYLGLWLGLSIYIIVHGALQRVFLPLKMKLKSAFDRASLMCVLRMLHTSAYVACQLACLYSVFLDYRNYHTFETTVVLQQDSLKTTHFPAVTVCNKEAINLTKICWEQNGKSCTTLDTSYFQEAILNNQLYLLKDIISYSYPVEELVLQCYMKTYGETCESFDCHHMWKIQYSYYKTGVCYSFDPSRSPIYRGCNEPWKYKVTFRLSTSIESPTVPEETLISAIIHEQRLFTGGVSTSVMFRPGKTYILSALQTDIISLEAPYETKCTDYVRMTQEFNYTADNIQAEECSERCLADLWKSHCDCYPKLYSMRHILKGFLCEYLTQLKCNDYMKTKNWVPNCQNQCTRPCREARYSSFSFQTGNVKEYAKYPKREMEVSVVLGTTRTKIVQTFPRMLGSDLITYLSGHVSMWLGVALLQVADLLCAAYAKYQAGKMWFYRRQTYWKNRGVVQIPFFEWIKYTAMQYYLPTHVVWDEIFKKYGPVVGTFTADTPTLMVAEPEMLKAIMVKDFASFPNTQFIQRTGDPVLDNTLVALLDDDWRAARATVAPTFSTGKMKQMIPVISECTAKTVDHLLSAARTGKPYDIKQIFSAFTLDVIARTNYRVKVDSYDDVNDPFVRHASCFFGKQFKWRAFLCFQFPRLSRLLGLRVFTPKAIAFFYDLMLNVLQRRTSIPGKETERPDFITLLMNAQTAENESSSNAVGQRKKSLSKEKILAQAVLFFVAGFDTSSNALAMTLYYLAHNQDIQKRLADEVLNTLRQYKEVPYEVLMNLKYLDAVVQETLRINAPIVLTYRTCARTTTVCGIPVEKGSFIRIPIYSLHRDERYFPDPEVFNPERFLGENRQHIVPFSFIPFGEGPRQCIGMKFAWLEYKMCLFDVIARVAVDVCPETKVPPTCHASILVMVPDNMVLKVTAREALQG
ncbi:uncharacterized protein LOC135369726 [Ornithodoros turicata]|uniref:uncharacterized protein LOC135369726 n=1 Tax=Ornithodoros turicata TaxID=34597 RepID=UPI003139236C